MGFHVGGLFWPREILQECQKLLSLLADLPVLAQAAWVLEEIHQQEFPAGNETDLRSQDAEVNLSRR